MAGKDKKLKRLEDHHDYLNRKVEEKKLKKQAKIEKKIEVMKANNF